MKITVIHGSMRKGNTYGVTQAVLSCLREHSDVEITEISVADLDLPFCLSCHTCFGKGENLCPHREKVSAVAKAIENCDGLIVSGVVYAMQINAAMKNLIDHLAYYFHRPRLFDKIGMVITTTAGAGENRIAKYLSEVLGHWGISGAVKLSLKIQTPEFSISDKQKKQIQTAADKFYDRIKNKKLSSPSFVSIAVHNAFRGTSALKQPFSECDAAYWRDSGFADSVYSRRVGLIKSVVGHLAYFVMQRVFGKDEGE